MSQSPYTYKHVYSLVYKVVWSLWIFSNFLRTLGGVTLFHVETGVDCVVIGLIDV